MTVENTYVVRQTFQNNYIKPLTSLEVAQTTLAMFSSCHRKR